MNVDKGIELLNQTNHVKVKLKCNISNAKSKVTFNLINAKSKLKRNIYKFIRLVQPCNLIFNLGNFESTLIQCSNVALLIVNQNS